LCRYREEHAKVVDEARMVPAVKLTAINAHGVLGTIILWRCQVDVLYDGVKSMFLGEVGICIEEAKS
jgi:hypothetical protein